MTFDIQNISEDQLNTIFGDNTTVADSPLTFQEGSPIVNSGNEFNLPEIDIEALEKSAVDGKENETPEKQKDADENNNDDSGEQLEEETPGKVPETEDIIEETPVEYKEVLKNTVSYLIDKGIWKDFEDRDKLELDDKTYAELALTQNKSIVEDMFNELVDSTGVYGKAIIDHIKGGGNPDLIIDIFKEQKQIEAIDTNNDEGKLELIGSYYSNVLGWKPDRIQKHLKRVIADEDLEVEFKEINDQYESHYKSQLDLVNKEREDAKKAAIERQKEFVNNIQKSLTEMGYTEKEKRFLENSLLDIKKLPDGNVGTQFNAKFSELQKDPKKLIKLVEFVMDEDNFINKIKTEAKTKASVDAFKFIKGNGTTSKTPSSQSVENNSKQNTLDFSSLLKNR